MQYTATQSLLELCEGSERTTGLMVGMRWWEQVGTNMVGEREAAVVVAEAEEDRMEE